MPKLCTGAVDALRRHLAPALTEENQTLRSQLCSAWERITMLEMLLRDMEAAELLHEHCCWCFGESAPEACERCVLLVTELRMRRGQALLGGKG
jgi:hypothetical protein